MAGSRRTNTFFPPATRDTFKDVLIFEERLKQNAERYAFAAGSLDGAGKLMDPILSANRLQKQRRKYEG